MVRENRNQERNTRKMMGYLVELKKKNGFLEPFGKRQKVLMSGEMLAELLLNKPSYYVISARSTNITEYQLNHDPKLEVWQ